MLLRLTAWLTMAGKVVLNCCVGLGPPLTVTVGTPGAAVSEAGAVGVDEAAMISKRDEVACRMPLVLLMKMRK